jgi:hypothetical protein
MKKYLVIENSNYADEFDLQGYKIIEAESEQDLKNKILKDKEFPCEFHFGTNEATKFETEEELFEALTIKELTDIEAITLIDILGKRFGITSII